MLSKDPNATSSAPVKSGSTQVSNSSFNSTATLLNFPASSPFILRNPGVSTALTFWTKSCFTFSKKSFLKYVRNSGKAQARKQRRNSFKPMRNALTSRANGGSDKSCLGGTGAFCLWSKSLPYKFPPADSCSDVTTSRLLYNGVAISVSQTFKVLPLQNINPSDQCDVTLQ